MSPKNTPNIVKISKQDNIYSARLYDLFDPPSLLYIYGDIELLKLPVITIVGSPATTPSGLESASFFAQGLARAGLLVIFGLARGIDGAVQR